LRNLIKSLFFGKLAKAGSWLFIGSIISGILGYLFQIILGRMLSVAEYGVFNTIISIMVLTGAPLITLLMLVSRKVSSYRPVLYENHRTHLFYNVNLKIVMILVVFASFALINLEYLQDFLQLEKTIYLYLLIILLFVAFPQSVNNAYLQGLQYFKWLSLSGVITTLLKIIISVVLIYAGLGLTGALGGVLISSFLVLILTYVVLLPSLRGKVDNYSGGKHFTIKSAIPVLLANVAFSVMTQIDMVLVKHYFSEQDAGLYAAASILGKAVMYLPGGIAMALFPMVAESHADGKSSAHFLIQAVVITTLLCTIGAFFYYYLSDSIIVLLYGENYRPAAEILKYFGFAMLPMALIMVAEHFLIAMGKVLFAYLFMIVAPLQLIAIYYNHDSMLSIVLILAITGFTLALLGYGLLWKVYSNGKTT